MMTILDWAVKEGLSKTVPFKLGSENEAGIF